MFASDIYPAALMAADAVARTLVFLTVDLCSSITGELFLMQQTVQSNTQILSMT